MPPLSLCGVGSPWRNGTSFLDDGHNGLLKYLLNRLPRSDATRAEHRAVGLKLQPNGEAEKTNINHSCNSRSLSHWQQTRGQGFGQHNCIHETAFHDFHFVRRRISANDYKNKKINNVYPAVLAANLITCQCQRVGRVCNRHQTQKKYSSGKDGRRHLRKTTVDNPSCVIFQFPPALLCCTG